VPHEEIARELNQLAGAYPAFRFRTQGSPRSEGLRWVAERIDGLNPGLHPAMTRTLSTEQFTALWRRHRDDRFLRGGTLVTRTVR